MEDRGSLPGSIRQRLNEASKVEGDVSPENRALTEAMIELARSNPRQAALLLGVPLGVEGFDEVITEETVHLDRVEHRIFGFTVNAEYVPRKTTRTVTNRTRVVRRRDPID